MKPFKSFSNKGKQRHFMVEFHVLVTLDAGVEPEGFDVFSKALDKVTAKSKDPKANDDVQVLSYEVEKTN